MFTFKCTCRIVSLSLKFKIFPMEVTRECFPVIFTGRLFFCRFKSSFSSGEMSMTALLGAVASTTGAAATVDSC